MSHKTNIKVFGILLLLHFHHAVFAQDNQYEKINNRFEGSGISKLIFTDSPEAARHFALEDHEKGLIYLILHSGLAPVVRSSDKDFENKYAISYFEMGCVGPDPNVSSAYNQVAFEYLDDQYGKTWRKKVRKDVMGYKAWKKAN